VILDRMQAAGGEQREPVATTSRRVVERRNLHSQTLHDHLLGIDEWISIENVGAVVVGNGKAEPAVHRMLRYTQTQEQL
jgi:hypothetical protein